MKAKERKELANIEYNYKIGIPDTVQAKKMGLSKVGFLSRWVSLRKKELLHEYE